MKPIDDIDQQNNRNSAKVVVEALEKLNLNNFQFEDSASSSSSKIKVQSANDNSSSHHNTRLFDIARSIIELNINNKDKQNTDCDDSTLIKLLQTCQTVIDLLMVEAKQSDHKNELNSQHNNLIQENAKLRKLLTLQQKAIAYRRVNYSAYSDNLNGGGDLHSSATNDNSNLPEDSNHNSGAKLSQTISSNFQCIYCPKVFNDIVSYSKHISLRHLASNFEDPSSLSGNGSGSFIEYLQQKLATSQSSGALNLTNSTQLTDRLQDEICNLKEKLTQTQKALNEEKAARKSFETNLKSDFVQKVQQIQEQLFESISEIKFCRNEAQIAADLATNATKSCSEMVNSLRQSSSPENLNVFTNNQLSHKPIIKNPRRKSPQLPKGKSLNRFDDDHNDNIDVGLQNETESKIDYVIISKSQNDQEKKKSKKQQPTKQSKKKNLIKSDDNNQNDQSILDDSFREETFDDPEKEEEEGNLEDSNHLKQNLKKQLITQLIKLKEDNQNGIVSDGKTVQSKQNTKVSKKKKSTKKSNSIESDQQLLPSVLTSGSNPLIDDNNKESTKAEIYSSIENRLKSYLETEVEVSSDRNSSIAATSSGVLSSSSSSSSLSLVDGSKSLQIIDDKTYLKAVEKLQRDRNLVIHQSRYDYDFVEIESAIRSLIDTKLQSKINETAAEFNKRSASMELLDQVDNVKDGDDHNQQRRSNSMKHFDDNSDDYSVNLVETISDYDHEDEDDEEPEIEDKEQEGQDEEDKDFAPKSILKVNLKKKLKINEDNEPREPRKIKFSNELIEYEISPLQSDTGSIDIDDEDEDDEGEEYDPNQITTTNHNQMFMIKSSSSSSYGDDNNGNEDNYYLEMANGYNSGNRHQNRPHSATSSTSEFSGEKIYVNEFNSTSSSSTSSSSDDDDGDNHNNNNNNASVSVTSGGKAEDQPMTNQSTINVDVHVEPESTTTTTIQPIPAKRRTTSTIPSKPTSLSLANNTLNSLLTLGNDGGGGGGDQQNNNQQPQSPDEDEELFRSKSLRVTELAELIEKKLQTQQQRRQSILETSTMTEDDLDNNNDNSKLRKLPPIGSINTLAPLRSITSAISSGKSKQNGGGGGVDGAGKSTNTNDNPDDYDIYDF